MLHRVFLRHEEKYRDVKTKFNQQLKLLFQRVHF